VNLESKLYEFFSLTSFRPGQKEAITALLENKHTLAMLPTGTGKSLVYQLPGKLLKGTVIVISPLLSLMQDQVEQMKMNGEKSVVAINSFLTWQERNEVFKQIRQYKFVFISPEMISSEFILNILKKLEIGLFVIDEAHCISQWGYDFRPEYQNLGNVRNQLGNPLTLALTATATPSIRDDIKASLSLVDVKEVIYSVDRPNIALKAEMLAGGVEKKKRLEELTGDLQGPGIIYFSSKKLAEQMAAELKRKSGKRINAYHGGMSQEDRILIQQQFLNGQLDIVCATSAFGMGINKDNIRFVIHYHFPTQVESFLQEIGRAGRDRKESISILLYVPGDEMLAYQLIETELPNELQLQQFKRSLLQYSTYDEWSKKELTLMLGQFSETQWRILAANVQLEGKLVKEIVDKLEDFAHYCASRLAIKKQSIQHMLSWVHLKSCRRTFFTGYFEEAEIRMNPVCCDNCGFSIASFYSKEKTNNERIDEVDSWKKQLAFILNMKSGPAYE